MTQQIPENSRPITTEELLQTIGELFVQTRILQRLLAEQSRQLVSVNGKEASLDPARS